MFCHKCGSKVADDGAFCHKCGAKITGINSSNPDRSDTTQPLIDLIITYKVKNVPKFMMKDIICEVFVDNQKLGQLLYDETATFKIVPGRHCIVIGKMNIWLDVPEGNAPIILNMQPDENDKMKLVCNQINLVMPAPPGSPPKLGGKPYCPHCGSQDIYPISESEVKVSGGGYGFGSGCCGWILLGPIGLLCGFCGRGVKSKSETRQFWLCKSCGHKFRNADDEYREKKETLAGMFGVFLISLIASGIFDYLDINFLWLSPRIYQIIGLLGMAGIIAGRIYLFFENQKR